MNKVELLQKLKESAFNKSGYSCSIGLKRLFSESGLPSYCDYDNNRETHIIDYATPEFQRSADKWTNQQQVSFVQNILKGYKTEIILFRFCEDEDAKILDGLQRLTAIRKFFEGDVKPFGVSYFDFNIDLINHLRSLYISTKIITFNKWYEVGEFYVEINEGITHSDKDIQKCKDWFFNVRGIKL